ncbi:MAG: NAD-dependent DNA ligase LigA, partial [Deltaproteobacteria bacterium]|nr:NAD-dependent DNA ligase LigA [Deltaproteobacteria bacterium]
LYYVLDKPRISDRQYDALFQELKSLERDHPELITPASPTQRVGEQPRQGAVKAEHGKPMFSLDNTYSQEELAEFDRRVRDGLPQKARFQYVAEPKLDGASVEIIYQNSVLYRGITRGDGRVGEDVTENIRTIRSLPLTIDESRPLTLRGEVVILSRDLQAINQERSAQGEEPFANPRNAASGSLRLMDPRLAAARPLRVYLYDLVETYYGTHSAMLDAIEKLGLPTHGLHEVCRDLDALFRYIDAFRERKRDLPYETDGVVVKVDELNHREILGYTARFPRWAIAFKYAAEQATTEILEIDCDVGRTGALTPVAITTPVFLSGTTVSRASLHNIDYVNELQLGIGDRVTIEKAGEIIPQVVKVVDVAHREPWKPPARCPACGSRVERSKNEVALRCPNPACPGRLKAAIRYFAHRSAMDIDHLGRALVEQLVDHGFIRDIADVFLLPDKRSELLELERMGEKSVDNLITAIEQARGERSFQQLLTALGIPLVGAVAAGIVAKKYRSLDRLLKVPDDELREALAEMHGIGPKIAESIAGFLADPKQRRVLEKLVELGVRTVDVDPSPTVGMGPLQGLSFCITGVLSRPRREIEGDISRAAGQVHDRVKKGTTYLVAGEKVGASKLNTAKKHGTKVISESELNAMLAGVR